MGNIPFEYGDYLIIPRGMIYQMELKTKTEYQPGDFMPQMHFVDINGTPIEDLGNDPIKIAGRLEDISLEKGYKIETFGN